MDIYSEITNRMIAEMEQGIIPWQKPWMGSGSAISHTTGKPYSLLNQMMLGRAGEYLTYKQVQQEQGWVRKGEKARMVVFWKWIDKEDEDTGEVKQIPFLRYYSVFHIDQCENIAAKWAVNRPKSASADETAEAIMTRMDPMSAAFLQMASIFSELEKSILRSRVRSGLANARAKGRRIGRKPSAAVSTISRFP